MYQRSQELVTVTQEDLSLFYFALLKRFVAWLRWLDLHDDQAKDEPGNFLR